MRRLKLLVALSLVFTIILMQEGTTVKSKNDMFNMSYIFFGSTNSYINQVNNTQGSLDVVSPNYFDINKDGALDITWRLQSSFINEMHRRGMKVVPFLANHWDKTSGINGLNNRDQLARDVANAIKTYNLDGVNVDIEGVGHAYREAHTEFIRLLRKYIPADKQVAVSVAANPNNWKVGWHGFYDYYELGKYADYLMIMAYDESWEGPDSPVGPVSSIQFFERSIQYAINQNVPKNKIVVGLPFYGRMWKLDGPTESGTSILGKGLSSTTIKPLVDRFGGQINFDTNTQSAFAIFTIPSGGKAYVGSTELTQGNYIIWFDNEQAIKAKLRMPSKYGIKGTGSWALYHETADTWDYYSNWLNGIFFKDVPLDYWATENINTVSHYGWMTGTSNVTFEPMRAITRGEMIVTLLRALGYADRTPKTYRFTDTKGHWGRKEIEVARELGFVEGKSPTYFAPNSPLTREELAQMLYNIFEFPVDISVSKPFPDISSNRWSYEAVLALNQKGVLNGYSNTGLFGPQNKSLRAEAAAVMDRLQEEIDRVKYK